MAKDKEFAPGIPAGRVIEKLPKLKEPAEWEFGVHRHLAERAGEHFDLRLGDPDTGQAHSWALRRLPGPGETRLAVQQPTHTVPYMDFKGRIESEYGRGDVELARRDKAEILRSSDKEVRFNLYPGNRVEEYALRRRQGNQWLLQNVTTSRKAGPGRLLPSSKPAYKVLPPEKLDPDKPQTELQAKIDGAHVLYHLKKPGQLAKVVSHRPTERETGVIEHTYRLPGFQEHRTPSSLRDTILRGELYAVDEAGKALPAARVGGLLNAGVWKSRQKQQVEGRLVPVAFDVVQYRGKNVEKEPYAVKKSILEKAWKSLPWLGKPRTAVTPEEKQQLIEDIKAGIEPSTMEGVIEWDLDRPIPKKSKFLEERDVFVRNIFPEAGAKRQGELAGGFEFSTAPKGPIVGRVGTGFSHAMKRDMLENPSKYEGLRARILAQRAPGHYAPRAPAFHSFHLDQELPENMKTAAVDPEKWISSNVKKPKNKCFFYSAALAALNPELKLYKGQHSGQFKGDTGHFYLKGPGGTIIDPTAAQYPKGKLVSLGKRVSVRKNLDYVVKDPLFKTLSKSDQQTILGRVKTAAEDAPRKYRRVGGMMVAKGVPYLRSLPDSRREAKKVLRAAIRESKDTWPNPQVAVKNLDLEGLGFEPTRLAIPMYGESLGDISWRSGKLHAHKAGKIYMVHKDTSKPGLKHLFKEVPPALWAKWDQEPAVKAASASARLVPREGGGMSIERLYVPPEERGKGAARKLLGHIRDKHANVDLWIRPRPYGDMPASIGQLKSFYESVGFKTADAHDNMVLEKRAYRLADVEQYTAQRYGSDYGELINRLRREQGRRHIRSNPVLSRMKVAPPSFRPGEDAPTAQEVLQAMAQLKTASLVDFAERVLSQRRGEWPNAQGI